MGRLDVLRSTGAFEDAVAPVRHDPPSGSDEVGRTTLVASLLFALFLLAGTGCVDGPERGDAPGGGDVSSSSPGATAAEASRTAEERSAEEAPGTAQGDATSQDSQAPDLHMAAKIGDLPRVEELLGAGVGVDARDEDGSTALFWAAATGRVEMATRLLAAGAEIDAVFPMGGAPMHAAVVGGHPSMVELLIRHGGAGDRPEWMGSTPVQTAARTDDRRLVRLLCGASQTQDRSGTSQALELGTPPYPPRPILEVSAGIGGRDAVRIYQGGTALLEAVAPDVLRPSRPGFGRLSTETECSFAAIVESLDRLWTARAHYYFDQEFEGDHEVLLQYFDGRTLSVVEAILISHYLFLTRLSPEHAQLQIDLLQMWVETLELSKELSVPTETRTIQAATAIPPTDRDASAADDWAWSQTTHWTVGETSTSELDADARRALKELYAARLQLAEGGGVAERLSFALGHLAFQSRYLGHRREDQSLLEFAIRAVRAQDAALRAGGD